MNYDVNSCYEDKKNSSLDEDSFNIFYERCEK